MELLNFATWQNCFRSRFAGTWQCSIGAWISFLAKGGGTNRRFQCCVNPNSSTHFLYFRAIQGHSGGTLVDPTLQDDVLLPDDFADYIYHIGNAHDMHSIIQGGLIPREKSQKGQAVSVFHTREPDVRQSRSGRSSIRSGQTQNYSIQNYLESSPKYSILVQFETCLEKRNAVILNAVPRNRSFQHSTRDIS